VHLYIGYKNYSSWSLRAWLILQANNIAFDETVLPIFHDDSLGKLANEWQVPKQVPILVDEEMILWDSLSIMEFLAEKYPEKNLWPKDVSQRAMARSASAEMHSGFTALRSQCPMNCRVKKRIGIDETLQQDLDRLAQLWSMFSSGDTKNAQGAKAGMSATRSRTGVIICLNYRPCKPGCSSRLMRAGHYHVMTRLARPTTADRADD